VSMNAGICAAAVAVRAKISERNATIGTLALVVVAAVFGAVGYVHDGHPGAVAIVMCLYGCLRRGAGGRRARRCVGFVLRGGGWNLRTSATDCVAGILVMGVGCVVAAVAQERVCSGGRGEWWREGCSSTNACSGSSGQRITCPEHVFSDSFNAVHAAGSWDISFWTRLLMLPIVALFFRG